jgi:uncharacterized protein YukE
MPRIQVVPEHLEGLSAQMSRAAGQLRDLEGRLGRALGGLDWQVRRQANVEGQVHAARRQALALADEAERLARFLTDRAAAFRQADAQGAESLGAATQAYLRSIPPLPTSASTPIQEEVEAVPSLLQFGDPLATAERISQAADWSVSLFLLYLVSRMKIDERGIVHVFGPQWLKEWVGFSAHLTRIRPEHLARHWLREELRLSFSPLANLQTAVGLLPILIEDYRAYSGQGRAAVVSAILVDGAISIVTDKVFRFGGAALGTLLTPVLGPLGPAAGYIAGGIVASYVEDWLRQTSAAGALRNAVRESIEQIDQWVTNLSQSALTPQPSF